MGTCAMCGKKNTTIYKKMCYRCRMEDVPVTSAKDTIKEILNYGKMKK